MIRAVFDCNVLISAIGWSGNPRACLQLVGAGQALLCVTPGVWEEYDQWIPDVLAAQRPEVNPRPVLDWLLARALFVEPMPLGKPRSRDLKDDRYLACALGGKAEALVTNDRDLLVLGKPFGIHVLTPVGFLKLVRGRTGF